MEGESLQDVSAKVLDYRVVNSIAVGHPEREIEEYLCTSYPHFCSGGGAVADGEGQPITIARGPVKIVDIAPSAPVSYLQRIINWIANRYRHAGNYNLVDASTAERRAGICVRCPMNQEWRIGCPPCVTKAEHDLILLRQNATTAHHRRLLGCRAAGHDNKTAVHLPTALLGHRKHYALPDICWMRSLQTSVKKNADG